MTKKKNSGAKQAKNTPFPSDDQVIQAAFDRIEQKGLAKLRLSDLADHFDVTVTEFYAAYPSVEDIFLKFLQFVDAEMLKTVKHGSYDSKRDLYFDMIMSRFDTIQSYRPGARRWLSDLCKTPQFWPRLAKKWDESLSLMLDVAKDSPLLPLKKIGLAAVYFVTLRSWLNDDTADMSKTMADLDKALSRAHSIASRLMGPTAKAA